MNQKRSITESPNFLSADIDLAAPIGIVRILRQADAQIFSGFLDYPGLFDRETIEQLAELALRAEKVLANPKGRIVLSGAGTSGRLAMFGARVFNAALAAAGREPIFRYLMAGGDAALIQAFEGAEDDPHQSVIDLENATSDADDIFYVGITCGLSAPYVAGQLEHIMSSNSGFAVLLGFNPVELARDTPIEGWNETFRDIARKTESPPNAAVLNPVIGPEPITGSTRMKSGSATKILLEVLFYAAINLHLKKTSRNKLGSTIIEMLREYENASRSVYLSTREIGDLIQLGGDALKANGHIYYLGNAGIDSAGNFTPGENTGILGIIDASECPPTYGASFDDVRGFVLGGWDAYFPGQGKNLSSHGRHYQISAADFEKEILPDLGPQDLCVSIGSFEEQLAVLESAKQKGARTAVIDWHGRGAEADAFIAISDLPRRLLGSAPLELQVKLVINALTTGAHVLAGKVFGNRMIDLRISNNKLFHRTVGIISDLMQVSPEESREALLKSIYQTENPTAAQLNAPIRNHIESAKAVDKVVPKALLIATGQFTPDSAAEALRRNPVVRTIISQYVKQNTAAVCEISK